MDRARKGEYIEYFNVHGNMYGTHEVTTSKIISLGKVISHTIHRYAC